MQRITTLLLLLLISAIGFSQNQTDPAAVSIAETPSSIGVGANGTVVAVVQANPVSGSTSNLPAGYFQVTVTFLNATYANFNTTTPLASASQGTWSVISSAVNQVIIRCTSPVTANSTQISLVFNIIGASAGSASSALTLAVTSNTISPRSPAYGDKDNTNNSASNDVTVNAITPIALTSFTAAKTSNANALIAWTTTQESNVNQFAVERSASTDVFGIWTSIGIVKPTNTSAQHSYQLTDNTPLIGDNFYRLKSVDNDGSFTISKTESLNFSTNGFIANLYPSPVLHSATLKIGGENAANYIVYITDISGKKVVDELKVNCNSISTINLDRLSAGTYTLTISDVATNKKMYNQLFIKQ